MSEKQNIKQIRKILEKADVDHRVVDDMILVPDFKGKDVMGIQKIIAQDDFVLFITSGKEPVDDDMRDTYRNFSNDMNRKLVSGSFDIDMEGGEMRFRSTLIDGSDTISSRSVMYHVRLGFDMICKFNDMREQEDTYVNNTNYNLDVMYG